MAFGGPGNDGWRKSSRCEANNCVEVALGGHRAGVRNNALPYDQLSFSAPAWRSFIDAVCAGEFAVKAR
jgi:Domain of unknown function (DUF397)